MSVETWEVCELTGDFLVKQHSCPFSTLRKAITGERGAADDLFRLDTLATAHLLALPQAG
jgi:hypothetical protein